MAVTLVVLLLAAVFVPSLVIMAMAFVAFLRADDYDLARRRREQGLCAECGYDLRGSTGRCSECGAAVPVKAVLPPKP